MRYCIVKLYVKGVSGTFPENTVIKFVQKES